MPTQPRPPLPAAPAAAAPRRRRMPWAALGLLAALGIFVWGIIHLFELRFAGGDVYPAYSTLRKDPLGAAAFHDALEALPALSVERNLRPLTALAQPSKLRLGPLAPPDPAAPGSGTGSSAQGPLAFFYLGADAYEWPFLFRHGEFERLDAILRQGGRVVLTFLPGQTPLTGNRLEKLRRDQSDADENSPPDPPFQPKATPGPSHQNHAKPSASPGPSAPHEPGSPSPAKPSTGRRAAADLRREDLAERWGVDFRREEPSHQKGAHLHKAASPTASPSPGPVSQATATLAHPAADGPLKGAGKISWHSVLDYDLGSPEARAAGWRSLYQREGRPVIVARPVGDKGGELILASDSYFLSNEALRTEACPALLAELVGPARHVVFDETHLGIAERPGMMTLARRYHLQAGLAALGLLAALFLWRNVASLVPPPVPSADPSSTRTTTTGRDAAAGFLNLLRRGVSPRELIATCLAQWQHAPGPRAPDAGTVERLRILATEEAARPASRRSPATAYRAMCAALHRPR